MRSSRATLACLGAIALAVLQVYPGRAWAQDPAPPNGGDQPAAPGTYSQTEIEGATRTRRPPTAEGAPGPGSSDAQTQPAEAPQRVAPESPRRRQAAYDPGAPPPAPPPVRAPGGAPA